MDMTNSVTTWMWVKFRLLRGIPTDEIIRIRGISGKRKNSSPIGDWVWNGVYPLDSSFYPNPEGQLQLSPPCYFSPQGVTFMFGGDCDNEDRQKLKDNYIYQMWVLQKWFHQGPMRMFPLVVDMTDWPEVRVPDLELPWIDTWEEKLIIPPMCDVTIQLEGIQFTPMADMDVIMGIKGEYDRSAQ